MKDSKKPSLRSLKKQEKELSLSLNEVRKAIRRLKSGTDPETLKKTIGKCYKITTMYGVKFVLVREVYEDRASGIVYRPNSNVLARLPEVDMNATIFGKEASELNPINEIPLNTFSAAINEGAKMFKKTSGKVFLRKIAMEAISPKK